MFEDSYLDTHWEDQNEIYYMDDMEAFEQSCLAEEAWMDAMDIMDEQADEYDTDSYFGEED